MDFKPEHYHRAALERMDQAWVLYRQGSSYALSMSIAGVAVECMLRAFKMRRDRIFDERHDLLRIFKASGMLGADPSALQAGGFTRAQTDGYERELRDAVNTVSSLWLNNVRYASEDRMRAHLKTIKGLPRAKGGRLKSSALRLIQAAESVIQIGAKLWDI